uniref:Xyloglucan endotransglucosylase/hydrolase n=1 Tax=Lotus japonicus TaxID=34305 RepID=I3SSU5_LOTJA|nr:unknown [Lotus japonicus]
MGEGHMGFMFCFSLLLVLSSGSSRNLPIIAFEEGYTHLFGDNNLIIHEDGKSVHLSLDERTGSGFVSHDLYLHGFFSASIKLPADYTAGVVVAFYMSNGDMYEKNHDEIDFEFLGNIRGKNWRVQTNVYGNGSTNIGREERFGLWFDPSEDFHQYSILWTDSKIIFYVDNVPMREVERTESMGGDFPSKPMNFDPIEHVTKCDIAQTSDAVPSGTITPSQRVKMEKFRLKHMTYSYCYDRIRYKASPPECVINPKQAERLRKFDPVTFGNGRNHHGKRHHHSRGNQAEAVSF